LSTILFLIFDIAGLGWYFVVDGNRSLAFSRWFPVFTYVWIFSLSCIFL